MFEIEGRRRRMPSWKDSARQSADLLSGNLSKIFRISIYRLRTHLGGLFGLAGQFSWWDIRHLFTTPNTALKSSDTDSLLQYVLLESEVVLLHERDVKKFQL